MKVLVLFLAGVTLASRGYKIYSVERADAYFNVFIDTYDKQYASLAEKMRRFEIFKQNLVLINKKNLEDTNAVFGITKYSDLTKEEFINMYTGLRGGMFREGSKCKPGSMNSSSAPDDWDWKDKGVVSKVKDQRMCGSCWAFSAIGNVEAQYAMKHKELLDLSEQQLVDCDKRSNGCDGTHDMSYPFLYLRENSGSMQEQDYPYTGKSSVECKFDASKVKVKVADCITYSPETEEELKNILYSIGPVSVGLDASDMQYYHHGVLKECSYSQLNHAILVVGYGSESSTPYWLIKNSWGESFGEDGFIKIERGVNACGLMSSVALQAVIG